MDWIESTNLRGATNLPGLTNSPRATKLTELTNSPRLTSSIGPTNSPSPRSADYSGVSSAQSVKPVSPNCLPSIAKMLNDSQSDSVFKHPTGAHIPSTSRLDNGMSISDASNSRDMTGPPAWTRHTNSTEPTELTGTIATMESRPLGVPLTGSCLLCIRFKANCSGNLPCLLSCIARVFPGKCQYPTSSLPRENPTNSMEPIPSNDPDIPGQYQYPILSLPRENPTNSMEPMPSKDSDRHLLRNRGCIHCRSSRIICDHNMPFCLACNEKGHAELCRYPYPIIRSALSSTGGFTYSTEILKLRESMPFNDSDGDLPMNGGCIPCKNSKIVCNKTVPCSSCSLKNSSDLCRYSQPSSPRRLTIRSVPPSSMRVSKGSTGLTKSKKPWPSKYSDKYLTKKRFCIPCQTSMTICDQSIPTCSSCQERGHAEICGYSQSSVSLSRKVEAARAFINPWTRISIAGRNYDVELSKIPYLEAWYNKFDDKRYLVHKPIPLFYVVLRALDRGYHQCFKLLEPRISLFKTLCETYDFLQINVFTGFPGISSLQLLRSDIRRYMSAGPSWNTANDVAFQLVYLMLTGNFDPVKDTSDRDEAYDSVLIIVSRCEVFFPNTRNLVRAVFFAQFMPSAEQVAELNSFGI